MSNELNENQMIERLDQLVIARKSWENGTLRASNQELYGLLDSCATLYEMIRASTKLAKRLNARLVELNIQSNTNASLPLRVVRYVFGAGGQEQVYSKTIKTALDRKPAKKSMAVWLTENGGPAGVITMDADGKTKKQQKKANLALGETHFTKSPALTTFKASIPELLPKEGVGNKFAIALVRQSAGGTFDVVFGTSNAALVNSVLVEAGKSAGATASKAAIVTKVTTRQQRVDSVIAEFQAEAAAEEVA